MQPALSGCTVCCSEKHRYSLLEDKARAWKNTKKEMWSNGVS